MAVKNFLLNENQKVWDSYYNSILESWKEENRELDNEKFVEGFNKKKISVLQYKPITVEFESYINKSFNNITVADIEDFARDTTKKSKLSHLNAFLLAGVTSGNIECNDTKVLICLLPEAYRKLGKMIAGN